LAAQRVLVQVAEAADPATLAVELSPGVALMGSVTAEDGSPLANATVIVLDAQGEPLAPLQGAKSSKAGEFTLTGLAYGEYAVVAARGDRWSAVRPFALREGEPAPALTLAVVPAARLVVDRAGLREPAWIDVRDEQGRLLSGLLDWTLFTGGYGRSASTTESRYDLPAGNYSVRAVGARSVLAEATVALAAGEARRVTLR
jgi:hypothetical protein